MTSVKEKYLVSNSKFWGKKKYRIRIRTPRSFSMQHLMGTAALKHVALGTKHLEMYFKIAAAG